ncbi:simple sugar transport system permease protein [Paenibacillus phyllosphaerae]|uniref:Simple sugar transport system permease protein n=1 Tax=Paenibacillus phyllosphaerae TaxID=274593 RepID=A0A7W5AY37_9BACL|nr:ABC transporter permease [Paenibacillus phyllosphaerae]MBB3110271.1 simple sugar transport system permease protein [Paenibacillus phyllosphaerae]
MPGNKLAARAVTVSIETLFYLIAIAVSLLAGALVMAAAGVSPWEAYQLIWKGAAGSSGALKETLVKATPLLFAGLSYTFAYRCGLFNIGAEGQIYIGALMGTMSALLLPSMPIYIHLPLALFCGLLGGALWGGIAGALKVGRGASEIINTIMLNYVAIFLISYMVTGPMKEAGGSLPQSASLPDSAVLPQLLGSRLHYGFFLAILTAIIIYWVLERTTWGYQIRSAGYNKRAAEVMGMPVKRNMLLVMMVSGSLAGLGGYVEIAGVQHRLMQNFSPGFGYDGIAVALLGNTHPIGNVLSALLFGGMRSGANAMQRVTGASTSLVYVIQAIMIIVMVCNRYWLGGTKKRLREWLIRKLDKTTGTIEAGAAGSLEI